MQTHIISHAWYKVSHLWSGLMVTDWLHVFAVNGSGLLLEEEFSGWKQSASGDTSHCLWHGQIRGGRRRPGFYYAAAMVSDQKVAAIARGIDQRRVNFLKEKSEKARAYLESFANPLCRCRLGFHWKCAIHGTWMN